MSDADPESQAFYLATLRSELYRTAGLLGVLGLLLVYTIARALAFGELRLLLAQAVVLDSLNSLLAEDLPANRFITFALVFVDPVSSHVKVLSAGHGPILWYRYADDKIENLEAQGIPLGMIPSVKYSQAGEICLAPGDMVVLVTDGFYEWEDPDGEQFGFGRLEAVIRESRDCRAEEAIGRLRSAVESFSKGSEQKDDLTAIVLKRKTIAVHPSGNVNCAQSDRYRCETLLSPLNQ